MLEVPRRARHRRAGLGRAPSSPPAPAPHSPPNWRVNGPLSNMEEFAQAFGCRTGDPMVRSEAEKIEIW